MNCPASKNVHLRELLRAVPSVFALLVLLLVPNNSAADAGKSCAWPGLDPKTIAPIVKSWWEPHGDGDELLDWSVGASVNTINLTMKGRVNSCSVAVELNSDCTPTTRVVSTTGKDGWPSHGAAEELGRSLGNLAIVVEPNADADRTSTAIDTIAEIAAPLTPVSLIRRAGPTEYAFFIIAAIFIVVSFARRNGLVPCDEPVRAFFRVRELLLFLLPVFALLLLSAWPVFQMPFIQDSQILRWAYAATNPFRDWNHPFLSYLLNMPVARLTASPALLRVMPFLWVAAETLVFSLLAMRLAGKGAAALVAVWMAASIRSAAGMTDIGDWDLAGFFLGCMVLWLGRAGDEPQTRFQKVVPALLLFLGCSSSNLMIVPGLIFSFFVFMRWRRSAPGRIGLLLVLGVLILEALLFLQVFILGRDVGAIEPRVDLAQFFRDLLFDTPPMGLLKVMPFLSLAGLVLWATRPHKSQWAFSLLTIVATLASLVYALFHNSMHGAYYFGLMKGPVYLAAAIGVASVWGGLQTLFKGRRGAWKLALHAVNVLLSAVIILTGINITLEPMLSNTGGIEKLPGFVDYMGDRKVPVYSLKFMGATLIDYQDVLNGNLDVSVFMNPDIETWARTHVTEIEPDGSSCGNLPARALAFWTRKNYLRDDGIPPCDEFRKMDCREILLKKGEPSCHSSSRNFCYFDCVKPPDSPATTTPDE